MKYSYQAEKLANARRCLMLPHTGGEAKSVAGAFQACSLAFREMDQRGLDDSALGWVATIKAFMDTTGVKDTTGQGTFEIKARGFTADQQLELSRAVDELAHWFERETWGRE